MEPISIQDIVRATNGVLLSGKEDTMIKNVSTNSKEIGEGTLFVPIIGERVDAHDFIDGALSEGVSAVLTSRHTMENNPFTAYSQAVITVEDTKEALQNLASFYRKQFTIPVIGITGSVGKTTTKEMVAAALETRLNVLKTAGNMNSQIGLPLTIFRIEKQHQAAVIEMGISEEGEMRKLAKAAIPTHAIITNIGVSHIGQLGSRENIRKEKMNIVNEFSKDSCLFLNGNDDLLSQIPTLKENICQNDKELTQNYDKVDLSQVTFTHLMDSNIVTFGTNPSNQYAAKDIHVEDGHTFFTLQSPDGEENMELQVLGEHNVYNALVAVAIANQLGIPASEAKIGLKNYLPIAMRGQILETNGIKVIDDTYNASPDSMKGGINVLLEIAPARRRIAVLADVLELGELSYQCHYEVGEYIATTKVDEVVTIGTRARAIAEAIENAKESITVNRHTITTTSFSSNGEAIEYLNIILKPEDVVLVKGSRGMHTDEIVKELTK
ncbi:MAG TPA: UDP-N-acetylmuramoyl-tripeptide--D-alanyl-D-alanine ligase [Lachnospiraceae bacterium]|nr:UDP-N-acetylmuramoyl-tripeptide--D-alanyl-D-alanine ligase [Lachnospiraceae bacterium]